MSEVRPFAIQASDESLEDLTRRLAATRWPDAETPDDWSQGVPLAYMQEVVKYWHEKYDWRARESLLNRWDGFKTDIDGLGIHFLHVRSSNENALPLVITHGWPGSIVEFQKVIGPLTEPGKHGGDDADAFHVICPTLPGYGFSDKPTKPGWNIEKIATAWNTLMVRLGYDKYVAQGGDWGSAVTTAIGSQNLGNCIGIHVNMPIVSPDPETMDDLSELEQASLAGMKFYQDHDSGYSKQQSTRPQTLGYGLADSPAGQAAWILEKFYQWMDCNGHPENAATRDELLDNIMMYWLTDSAASSARLYWESFNSGRRDNVDIPAGCSVFPKEIFRTSRRWAEKRYTRLIHFNVLEKGGHFAAFEVPETYLDEVRTCFRELR